MTFWTLTRAVCESCQRATQEIESYIGETHFRDYRFLTGARSRSKFKNYNTKRTVAAKQNETVVKIKVDVTEIGWLYVLPHFGLPEVVSNGTANTIKGFVKVDHVHWPGLKVVQAREGITAIAYEAGLRNGMFCRFLAKVAYCFAVLEHGYDALKESPLLPIITGTDLSGISKLIGSPSKPSFKPTDTIGFKSYAAPGHDSWIEMKIMKEDVPIYAVVYKLGVAGDNGSSVDIVRR